jgi:hypothetical protein
MCPRDVVFVAICFLQSTIGPRKGRKQNTAGPLSRVCVAHFDINRGPATTPSARWKPGATILGKGTINLATEGTDIHLVPHATAADLANLSVPIIIAARWPIHEWWTPP